jgi:UDP-GlcNAc:undecaprenyl-phosphate GlcNAc-1-phosphate transferase
MAQRAGVPVRVVAAVHWGFAVWHAALAVLFLHLPSLLKPLVVVPSLAVQLLWLWFVAQQVRRRGFGWRG